MLKREVESPELCNQRLLSHHTISPRFETKWRCWVLLPEQATDADPVQIQESPTYAYFSTKLLILPFIFISIPFGGQHIICFSQYPSQVGGRSPYQSPCKISNDVCFKRVQLNPHASHFRGNQENRIITFHIEASGQQNWAPAINVLSLPLITTCSESLTPTCT